MKLLAIFLGAFLLNEVAASTYEASSQTTTKQCANTRVGADKKKVETTVQIKHASGDHKHKIREVGRPFDIHHPQHITRPGTASSTSAAVSKCESVHKRTGDKPKKIKVKAHPAEESTATCAKLKPHHQVLIRPVNQASKTVPSAAPKCKP